MFMRYVKETVERDFGKFQEKGETSLPQLKHDGEITLSLDIKNLTSVIIENSWEVLRNEAS